MAEQTGERGEEGERRGEECAALVPEKETDLTFTLWNGLECSQRVAVVVVGVLV